MIYTLVATSAGIWRCRRCTTSAFRLRLHMHDRPHLFSSPFLFLMVFVLVGLAYRWLNEGQRGKEEINVCIAKFLMVKTVASV